MTTAVAPAPVVPAAPVTPAPVIAAAPIVPATPAAIEYKFDPVQGLEIDPEFDTGIVETAKHLGLSADDAKKYRAFEIERSKASAASEAAAAKAAQDAAAQTVEGWKKANSEHAEYGGQKFPETTAKVDKLFAEFDPKGELLQELSKGNLQHEPRLFAFLARLAHAHGEGKIIQAGNQQKERPLHERLFPELHR